MMGDDDFECITISTGGEDNEYVLISVFEYIKFNRKDELIDIISLLVNNMVSYIIAVGEEYTYFIADLYKFIENGRTEPGSLLYHGNNSRNPFDYHPAKCSENCFGKLNYERIHT